MKTKNEIRLKTKDGKPVIAHKGSALKIQPSSFVSNDGRTINRLNLRYGEYPLANLADVECYLDLNEDGKRIAIIYIDEILSNIKTGRVKKQYTKRTENEPEQKDVSNEHQDVQEVANDTSI